MNRPQPLTYLPAYLGLFAALVLAVASNAFLDLHYGTFAFETGFWAILFAVTLAVGYLQRGETQDWGRAWQKSVAVLTVLLFVVVFMRVWGMPRAAVGLLAGLQAANNCVATTRRQLYLGLLGATALVVFAAAHHRADWTLLFYILPFVVAVVLTLVAEQVNRRSEELQRQSLAGRTLGGQGVAIVAASALILVLAGGLYLVTPQVSPFAMSWRHGLPAPVGELGGATGIGGQGGNADGTGGGGGDSAGSAAAGQEEGSGAGRGWPSPGEMRAAANRPGMPEWQASAMRALADLSESLQQTLQPVAQSVADWWAALKEWLKQHRAQIVAILILAALLAMLVAAWWLWRETRPLLWLRTRFDYLRYVLLGRPATGRRGVVQLYRAVERLFAARGEPRAAGAAPREYGRWLAAHYPDLRTDLEALMRAFERVRYGEAEVGPEDLAAMRLLYRRLFQGAAQYG